MKDVVWVGSSKKDLQALPPSIKQAFGYALSEAQAGRKPAAAKPFKLGSDSLFEVVEDWSTDTYRAFYTVKLGKHVYVLHCFQKKSPKKSETPKPDIATLEARLKAAKEHAKQEELSVKAKEDRP
jgi:phage-related protein